MNTISVKVKQAIESCLLKIREKTFDEDTIRTLLISTREYIKIDSIIRELAHFIAHPSRNQGIFHSKVNSRYAKFKLYEEKALKLLDMDSEKFLSNDELNNFLLGGVNVNKIDAKLFKILYLDGLDDIPEHFLIKYLNLSKTDIQHAMREYYEKSEGFYYLKVQKTEKMISTIRKFKPTVEEIETCLEAEKLIAKVRNHIDEIQKTIRGAIFFSSVFERDILSNEFQTLFLNVLEQFNIDNVFFDSVSLNLNDILLCIMTLLHDSKMIFYDKGNGRISLSIYLEDGNDLLSDEIESKINLYNNGYIALKIECETRPEKKLVFPIFVSDLKICDYIAFTEFEKSTVYSSFDELPWISAIRKNGRLILE